MSLLLPLFPLDLVLLPGVPLPLHVFEPRYKEMIAECLDEKKPFGVVRASSEGVADIGLDIGLKQLIVDRGGIAQLLTCGGDVHRQLGEGCRRQRLELFCRAVLFRTPVVHLIELPTVGEVVTEVPELER